MKPWKYVSRAEMTLPKKWAEDETEVDNLKKTFMLSAANIKKKSKHQMGWALDVAGDNARIKQSAKAAGATVIYDEASHVHLEFKNYAKSK